MSDFIQHGDTCESQKSHIIARKISFRKGGLRKDPITDRLMVLYYLDRNCSYEITESLNLNETELELRKSKLIHIEVGDKLIGDSIRVYADSKRNCLKPEVKEGVSGRHGAQIVKASIRTLGIISTPLEIYKNLLGFVALPKDNLSIK